jgi:hypothetical protein
MADGVYVEAKRSAIGGVAQVPFWIYGVMLALGWNEIYAVVSSPFYFLFLVLAAVLGYVVYTLNLWGPIYRVGNAMMEQGVEVGKVSPLLSCFLGLIWKGGTNDDVGTVEGYLTGWAAEGTGHGAQGGGY